MIFSGRNYPLYLLFAFCPASMARSNISRARVLSRSVGQYSPSGGTKRENLCQRSNSSRLKRGRLLPGVMWRLTYLAHASFFMKYVTSTTKIRLGLFDPALSYRFSFGYVSVTYALPGIALYAPLFGRGNTESSRGHNVLSVFQYLAAAVTCRT